MNKKTLIRWLRENHPRVYDEWERYLYLSPEEEAKDSAKRILSELSESRLDVMTDRLKEKIREGFGPIELVFTLEEEEPVNLVIGEEEE